MRTFGEWLKERDPILESRPFARGVQSLYNPLYPSTGEKAELTMQSPYAMASKDDKIEASPATPGMSKKDIGKRLKRWGQLSDLQTETADE